MAVEWLKIILLSLAVSAAARLLFGYVIPTVVTGEWSAAARWPLRRPPGSTAGRRSIEQAAHDLRRLGPRFHQPLPGTSRTKLEAARYAYDRALAEAAAAVGVEHLLGVLEPGDELDAERHRVEERLWLAGLRFEGPA